MKKMKTYWDETKKVHRNALLLFKMGNHYEAFYDDALTIARELDYGYDLVDGVERVSIRINDIVKKLSLLKSKGYVVNVVMEREP